MKPSIAGAIGGTLATVPMTLAMLALFRRLPKDDQYPLPPREITDEIARKAKLRRRLTEPQLVALSLAAHFAYGGATGALYPLMLRRMPAGAGADRAVGYQALFGCGYGVAVWAGSYLGWLPAFNVLAPATVQPAPRRRLMVAVHLIWGASTVLIGDRLAHQSSQSGVSAG